jgi:hypothetical protein
MFIAVIGAVRDATCSAEIAGLTGEVGKENARCGAV